MSDKIINLTRSLIRFSRQDRAAAGDKGELVGDTIGFDTKEGTKLSYVLQ